MKILYDYQAFYNQDFGGISRYFYELLKSYKNDINYSYELPMMHSNNRYMIESSEFKPTILPRTPENHLYKLFLKGIEFKGKRRLFNIKQKYFPSPSLSDLEANKKLSIEKIKEGNFDVFHPTYYDDYFLEYLGNKPYVISVYDMIYQIFPEYFLNGGIDKNKILLQNASKILAISESTKKDLVSFYGIDEKKVEVTYLANSLIPGSQKDINEFFIAKLPENYLLFVGNRDAYKNFYFFIQAYCILLNEFKDLKIVCTGKKFEIQELVYFENLGIKGNIYHYYIDDEKLSILYQNAKAFIFPSMYEGFGIPVLEAFACGCPVIISNAGSLPEIGENAALYFEVKDINTLLKAIRKVLTNSNIRDKLINDGFEQLRKFSWNKTVEKTKNIYKNVLANH